MDENRVMTSKQAREKVLNYLSKADSGYLVHRETFKTEKGEITLVFNVLPFQIEIMDQSDRFFQMSAKINLDDDGLKYAKFRIYNTKKGEKHPLISGEAFMRRALTHFETHNLKPDYVEAVWEKKGELASINAEAFEKSNDPNLETRAKQTWTGRVLNDLGYSKCEIIENDDEVVVVHFFKPPSKSK